MCRPLRQATPQLDAKFTELVTILTSDISHQHRLRVFNMYHRSIRFGHNVSAAEFERRMEEAAASVIQARRENGSN